MPKVKLTASFIDTLKVDVRTDYHDALVHGLSLRVAPSGTKTWNLFYTRESDGVKQRVKMGRYPAIDLEAARGKALKAMSTVADGEDPAESKRARKAALTVQELGALYMEKHARRWKKTWAEDERMLRVEVYPSIGRMKAEAVRRRDLIDIIEAKLDAGRAAQSTNILAVIRKLFSWAVDNDYLDASPAAGIKPRAASVSRDRVLSDAEVRQIWKALPEAAMSEATRRVFRLLFLTCQRSGEVAGITVSELDLEAKLWTIPASRTKNGLVHPVPLSDPAIEILRAAIADLPTTAENDAPLFAKIDAPIESNAVSKVARARLQITGQRWTPHDIRRTGATRMGDLGVAPHIVEAVLNHISGFRQGVAGTYQRSKYLAEKRHALDAWAERLAKITS